MWMGFFLPISGITFLESENFTQYESENLSLIQAVYAAGMNVEELKFIIS